MVVAKIRIRRVKRGFWAQGRNPSPGHRTQRFHGEVEARILADSAYSHARVNTKKKSYFSLLPSEASLRSSRDPKGQNADVFDRVDDRCPVTSEKGLD
jgi:hypothetical protein